MRISDWSSDVCSSDLHRSRRRLRHHPRRHGDDGRIVGGAELGAARLSCRYGGAAQCLWLLRSADRLLGEDGGGGVPAAEESWAAARRYEDGRADRPDGGATAGQRAAQAGEGGGL